MNATLKKVIIIAAEFVGYLLVIYAARNLNSGSNSRLRSKTGHSTINDKTDTPMEGSHSSSADSQTETMSKETNDNHDSDPIIYDSITTHRMLSGKVDLGNGRHTFG